MVRIAPPRRASASAIRAIAIALCLVAAPLRAQQILPGVSHAAPVMTSDAAPNRQALIIAPSFAGSGGGVRGALAQADAKAYRDVLRLLGFDVTTIVAGSRPDLDMATRGFADQVKRGGDVAVFALGTILSADKALVVTASDAPLARDLRPEMIAAEGLRLGDIARRIADHGPREIVFLVDECGAGDADPSCPIGPATFPDGVSAIVAKRAPRAAGGAPVAGVATMEQDLVPLMREADLSFFKLFARLQDKLAGTNLTVASTDALTRTFAFLPADFLQRLPSDCNRVDGATSAEALRPQPSLDPLVRACERMAAVYDFSSYFKDKLALARDQRAFQKAVADCGDAAPAYLDTFANGAYRAAVSEHIRLCQARVAAPPSEIVAPQPSLRQRAIEAVATYYEKHQFEAGGRIDALAALYPDTFLRGRTSITRSQHLRDLGDFYNQYTSIRFQPEPATFDLSACTAPDACLVRGQIESTTVNSRTGAANRHRLQFSLRFDLRSTVSVLYECAVSQPRRAKETACD